MRCAAKFAFTILGGRLGCFSWAAWLLIMAFSILMLGVDHGTPIGIVAGKLTWLAYAFAGSRLLARKVGNWMDSTFGSASLGYVHVLPLLAASSASASGLTADGTTTKSSIFADISLDDWDDVVEELYKQELDQKERSILDGLNAPVLLRVRIA